MIVDDVIKHQAASRRIFRVYIRTGLKKQFQNIYIRGINKSRIDSLPGSFRRMLFNIIYISLDGGV